MVRSYHAAPDGEAVEGFEANTRRGRAMSVGSYQGLPEPPEVGTSALPTGTFEGQTVLVTGGGTGLGKAIATEFARLGASVAIASRKPEHLDAGLDAIRATGARAQAVQCDIRDPESVATAFDSVVAELGMPQVLVNNAAANFPVTAEDMSPNAWRTVVDITLNGTFFCAREFGRRHLSAGTPGSIINVGASYAWTGGPGFAHSAAAKAGVKNMVESLAVEWGPYGIQVNGLVPGLFPHDDMTADIKANLARHHEPDALGNVPTSNEKDVCQPAMRVGRLRELGWAATFLASPYARFISGHTLVVDGANWQRRSLTNPPVVTVRDQMGKGPFEG
jgi:NAD(P)-dependent dehydrogenase (short-subunit alcohol dehydrogenase family)